MAELVVNQGTTGAEGPNDKDMIAKAEALDAAANAAKEEPKVDAPAIPDYIPEQFRNAEDPAKALAEAYAELRKKMDEKPTDGKAKEEPKAAEGDPDAAAGKAVEAAGLDMAELSAEFEKDGKLADASYEKLEKAGIPRAMVDAYIEGVQLSSERAIGEVVATIGGKENFDAMAEWAAANLDAKELEAYNKATVADVATAKLAVQGIWAKYQEANGSDPKLITGKTGANPGEAGYESMAQMTADMKDPRYTKDPAFRAAVERKAANSKGF